MVDLVSNGRIIMDRLFEAIDRYNEDKNETQFYSNILKVGLNYDEMIYVLKDVLGDKYDRKKLGHFMDLQIQEMTSSIPSIEATDEDFR